MINHDDQTAAMQDTMDEIERSEPTMTMGQREVLLQEISIISSDIKAAQEGTESSSRQTPEQANEIHRNLVFLKKDLEKKTSQYNSRTK